MVHIKKVEIFGFKSFGFKNTTVQFEPGLVSISGPNGSGKSNILDAIIFATCEKTPSVMRVDKIRSLLHDLGGATTIENTAAQTIQKPNKNHRGRRMARVALHFDNTDRKIPVSSDAVSITRELEENGDTTYYLNGKKDNRSHIVDLLDVAHVGPGNLNVVQQGTVTRIAEYSPIQKRESIEGLIGISSFDEKAEKAHEQLDYADRKLEIALASMGEVKNQIDMLEVERNIKMRHDLIMTDLKRYRAIDAIAQLRKLKTTHVFKEKELSDAKLQIDTLKIKRDENISDATKLNAERSEIMESETTHKHKMAELQSQIAKSISVLDAAKSSIKISTKRISDIRQRLDSISTETKQISASKNYTNTQIQEHESLLADEETSRDKLNDQLMQINSELHNILQEQAAAVAQRTELDNTITKLNDEKNEITQQRMQATQNHTNHTTKIREHTEKLEKTKQLAASLDESIQGLDTIMKNSRDSISDLESRITRFAERRTKAESDKNDLESVLEQSNNAATKYESKIKTVKGFMYEDYTVAKLKEDAQNLGILGLVYEMMSWDKEYERPVMAASSDWIKAIVVRDFDALLVISEAARLQKLPKFKVIPMDAIISMLDTDTAFNNVPLIDNQTSLSLHKVINGIPTLGTLADYIKCSKEYTALRTFLFGNVMLVEDRDSAIAISKLGYKTVTVSGEYFEAKGGTVIVDINSKISKITRLISMSSDVEGLIKSISLIRRYIQKKNNFIKKIDVSIKSHHDRISVSERRLATALQSAQYAKSRLNSLQESLVNIPQKISELHRIADDENSTITSCLSGIERVQNEINITNATYKSGEHMQIAERLGVANNKKSDLNTQQDEITTRCSRIGSDLSGLRADIRHLDSQDEGLKKDIKSLNEEMPDLEKSIKLETENENSEHVKITELRQKEQDMIDANGSSMDKIKEYDVMLDKLRVDERSLSKEISSLDKSSYTLSRDLETMLQREAELRSVVAASNVNMSLIDVVPNAVEIGDTSAVLPLSANLSLSGITTDDKSQDTLDVSQIVSGLESELASLAELNANAPAKYAEITYGYKMKSVRKNSLESERNSIVGFINRIEREKRQTFLDAFETVNSEISTVFKKMTGGGKAWLELQDEDDIFSSGISYLVQFPDKPHRESTSISGGEKTLAAVVFVLGLQKLQPSPFYLFDEVDAHLDAPNAEKLSNILAERARDSQFIVVSLKDSVVKKASLVYGVYPKSGVSNVVTYNDRRLRPSSSSSSSPQPVAR